MNRLILIVLFFTLAGCSSIHSDFNDSGTSLMAWENNLSAAYSIPPGDKSSERPKACMKMALAMIDSSNKLDVSLSDALVKVLAGIPSSDSKELLKVTSEIIQLSKAFNISTERTSFLLAGGFYLCQYQANGMSENNVKEVALKLIEAAAQLKPSNQEGKTETLNQ
ncbi:MAG: hypothetical protein PHH11_15590 [Methylomonas sp.]|nr:hypothetical protein [Methylomonas sp.]